MHCCAPSPPQIFSVEGIKHIGIYAKRRIQPGEELSYDYKVRLRGKGCVNAERLPCDCEMCAGCPNPCHLEAGAKL